MDMWNASIAGADIGLKTLGKRKEKTMDKSLEYIKIRLEIIEDEIKEQIERLQGMLDQIEILREEANSL